MPSLPRGYAHHDVRTEHNLSYRPDRPEDPAHHVDVYRPDDDHVYPVVLYVHGGGFRLLSKDTHWLLARTFASHGFVVFNINYRLAPEHPYPAAAEDTAAAYLWMLDHAADFGADAHRAVVAGESAGANLALALAVSATSKRPEPWAREVWSRGSRPSALVPTCGMLQVSDPLRVARRKRLSQFVRARLLEASSAYLPHSDLSPTCAPPMADPLRVLEGASSLARPFPPTFAAVGTRDPLLDDTRRLARSLDRLGARCEARYYPGELHTFHALLWRTHARQYWVDLFNFLDETLASKPTTDPLRRAS